MPGRMHSRILIEEANRWISLAQVLHLNGYHIYMISNSICSLSLSVIQVQFTAIDIPNCQGIGSYYTGIVISIQVPVQAVSIQVVCICIPV